MNTLRGTVLVLGSVAVACAIDYSVRVQFSALLNGLSSPRPAQTLSAEFR